MTAGRCGKLCFGSARLPRIAQTDVIAARSALASCGRMMPSAGG